ncbi:MAG TPA: hypothetical protein VKB86_22780 [Pyrinomonadaceae bacterium]|nr:hypothetical protein [Pyrinomonadaceae bacterium]
MSILKSELERIYESLAAWCRKRDYAGHDPFDALNSRLFQSTPLKHSRAARLVWTQLFKRSPVSFRKIARIPTERNSKGTALFALAALAEFRRTRTIEAETEARELLDDLKAARIETTSGAAWGYNFDWQGRAFFAPKGTPTIVPTAFAARALTEAARDLNDDSYLNLARDVCAFILNDLPRSFESETEICWSYSPVDRTRIFNASLLAAETLASVGALTCESTLCELAVRGARYVVRHQREDGSWAYGADEYQSWADNFHTAFVLTSMARIMRSCTECHEEFLEATKRGLEFWRERFFLANGWPKYFHDRLYPADAHSAGAALVALVELKELDEQALELGKRIALWAIENLRDGRGFFYYQRRRFYTVRTPYMRWSQSWMMYGLARLLEEGKRVKGGNG